MRDPSGSWVSIIAVYAILRYTQNCMITHVFVYFDAMSDSPGLRDRKKQRTRRAIEQSALDLFETHGFDGTTIDEIADAADISPRTFFHYFPSKEDVVLADYALRLESIVAALEASLTDQAPWAALRAAFLTVGADYESERERSCGGSGLFSRPRRWRLGTSSCRRVGKMP